MVVLLLPWLIKKTKQQNFLSFPLEIEVKTIQGNYLRKKMTNG